MFLSIKGQVSNYNVKEILNTDLIDLYKKHISHFYNFFNIKNNNVKIIIFSGKELFNERCDSNYTFYSYSNFAYLCYHNLPNCFIVFSDENVKPLLYLDINYFNSFWHKAEPIDSIVSQVYEIRYYSCDVSDFIKTYELQEYELVCDYFSSHLFNNFQNTINSTYIIEKFNQIRYVKTEYEISCIRIATKFAFNSFNKIRQIIHSDITYVSEKQLVCEFISSVESDNLLPYNPIFAMNQNCSYLHHNQYSSEKICVSYDNNQEYSILIDAGVFYRGYACDITISHSNNPMFKLLSDLVCSIKDKIINFIKPNVTFGQIQEYSNKLIAKCLIDMNIIDKKYCSEDNIIKYNVTKYFFPHGCSHSLGICVHDVNEKDYKREGYLRNKGELKIGTVITIEPGIYFIDSLLKQLYSSDFVIDYGNEVINNKLIDRLKIFGGIRHEDNVVVTKHGCENITTAIFRK